MYIYGVFDCMFVCFIGTCCLNGLMEFTVLGVVGSSLSPECHLSEGVGVRSRLHQLPEVGNFVL